MNLLIADPRPLFRDMLAAYLQAARPICGMQFAATQDQLDGLIWEARPDIVLLHADIGGVAKFRAAHPAINVAGLDDKMSGSQLLALIDALLKDTGVTQANHHQLTPRETDVLGYLCQGFSNRAIAAALKLQIVTVKLHIRGIFRKLNAANRTQAALIAHRRGLVCSNSERGDPRSTIPQ